MLKQLLLVGTGGFLGSIARFFVSKLNITWSFHNIPLGTLIVNVLGSLIIGILMGFFMKNNEVSSSNNLRLLLAVGFCGGFTTFSAFANENFSLLQNGQFFTSFIYISVSITMGILAVFAGYILTK